MPGLSGCQPAAATNSRHQQTLDFYPSPKRQMHTWREVFAKATIRRRLRLPSIEGCCALQRSVHVSCLTDGNTNLRARGVLMTNNITTLGVSGASRRGHDVSGAASEAKMHQASRRKLLSLLLCNFMPECCGTLLFMHVSWRMNELHACRCRTNMLVGDKHSSFPPSMLRAGTCACSGVAY